MTFYERYTYICQKRDVDPCSQRTADMFGVTKSTISSWGVKGTDPKGKTVARIADALKVSTDYLLERTDDPTDYAKLPVKQRKKEEVSDALQGYARLDEIDQAKVDGIIQGLLLNDKYKKHKNKDSA